VCVCVQLCVFLRVHVCVYVCDHTNVYITHIHTCVITQMCMSHTYTMAAATYIQVANTFVYRLQRPYLVLFCACQFVSVCLYTQMRVYTYTYIRVYGFPRPYSIRFWVFVGVCEYTYSLCIYTHMFVCVYIHTYMHIGCSGDFQSDSLCHRTLPQTLRGAQVAVFKP
jgi:hypothetical protein